MATIARCATDVVGNVSIDRYYGYQQSLKYNSSRLPFKKYLNHHQNIDSYCLIVDIGVEGCRLMDIAQSGRFPNDVD